MLGGKADPGSPSAAAKAQCMARLLYNMPDYSTFIQGSRLQYLFWVGDIVEYSLGDRLIFSHL